MTQQPAAPRRARPALSQERIVDAALALVEREGPAALTLRRLGAELGADHTAVLRHFSGKDEIQLALVNRLVEVAVTGFVPAADWRETLAELARRIRAAYRLHPDVAALANARSSRRDSEFTVAEVIVGALQDAGFRGAEVASTYRALVDAALAMSAFDAAATRIDAATRAAEEAAWRREYRQLSAARYPRMAAVAEHLAAGEGQDTFEAVLSLILDGLAARRTAPGGPALA